MRSASLLGILVILVSCRRGVCYSKLPPPLLEALSHQKTEPIFSYINPTAFGICWYDNVVCSEASLLCILSLEECRHHLHRRIELSAWGQRIDCRIQMNEYQELWCLIEHLLCGDRFDGDCLENNPEAALDKSKPWSRSIEDLHGGSTLPSPITGNGLTRVGRHSTLRYSAHA